MPWLLVSLVELISAFMALPFACGRGRVLRLPPSSRYATGSAGTCDGSDRMSNVGLAGVADPCVGGVQARDGTDTMAVAVAPFGSAGRPNVEPWTRPHGSRATTWPVPSTA